MPPSCSLSRKTSAGLACCERYGDAETFLTTFNPSRQTQYCREGQWLERCYMGTAPTLRTVEEAYGESAANIWIKSQLRDLSNFSGVAEKLGAETYDQLADSLRDMAGHCKVTELMHFFLQMKTGKYGKFYGCVDGQAIMEAWRRFSAERMELLAEYRKRREEASREREAANRMLQVLALKEALAVCHMSHREWMEIEGWETLTLDEIREIGWLFRW